jgi:hypothetical protein
MTAQKAAQAACVFFSRPLERNTNAKSCFKNGTGQETNGTIRYLTDSRSKGESAELQPGSQKRSTESPRANRHGAAIAIL